MKDANNGRREGLCPHCHGQVSLKVKAKTLAKPCPLCGQTITPSMLLTEEEHEEILSVRLTREVEDIRKLHDALEERLGLFRALVKDLFPCFGHHDCNDHHRSKCLAERLCMKEKEA